MLNIRKLNVREIVKTTMKSHPKECIFAPDAENNIVAALFRATDEVSFFDIFEKAFKDNEIYCPHEGVDRRHLYPGYENAS